MKLKSPYFRTFKGGYIKGPCNYAKKMCAAFVAMSWLLASDYAMARGLYWPGALLTHVPLQSLKALRFRV